MNSKIKWPIIPFHLQQSRNSLHLLQKIPEQWKLLNLEIKIPENKSSKLLKISQNRMFLKTCNKIQQTSTCYVTRLKGSLFFLRTTAWISEVFHNALMNTNCWAMNWHVLISWIMPPGDQSIQIIRRHNHDN